MRFLEKFVVAYVASKDFLKGILSRRKRYVKNKSIISIIH